MTLTRRELAQALTHLERGDWQAAHAIVQKDEQSALACWAHGIVHLVEGDEGNARYWYGLAKRGLPHPSSVPQELSALKKAIG